MISPIALIENISASSDLSAYISDFIFIDYTDLKMISPITLIFS